MPEKFPDWTKKFGYGPFIHLEHRNCKACMMKGEVVFREVEQNCFSTTERLQDFDETGIDAQVLSTIPVLFNYWANAIHGLETARFFNDHIAETAQKHPNRYIPLGTVPMQDVDLAIYEMERCINKLGMPGIEIGSNINGENLSDAKFFPFFEAAELLGCAIFIHPWEVMGENQMQKYWLPWLVGMPAETTRAICSLIFGGIFTKLPNLRVAFAHGGGTFPYTIGRIGHGFDVRPDLVAVDNSVHPFEQSKLFWVDSLVHHPEAFRLLLSVMGEEKICLGSDYPFPLGEKRPGELYESMDFSKTQINKWNFENALNWLNLEVSETQKFEKRIASTILPH